MKFVNTEEGTSGETSTGAVVFQTNFKKTLTRHIDVFTPKRDDLQTVLTLGVEF